MITIATERFPREAAHLVRVRERTVERDARRHERLVTVADLSTRRFTEALDALRVRMAFSARQTPDERGSAFAALPDHDLALLDRSVARSATAGRFRMLHQHSRVQELLDVLRVNYVTREPVVSGAVFRDVTREMLREAVSFVRISLPSLRAWIRSDQAIADGIVVVLPWRASLICGEVYREAGAEHAWHIGAKRNEHTLATETYYDQAPPKETRQCPHLICDPMLATGGTTITVIERLLAAGVAERAIAIHSVVAAPEGVDLLLHMYPGIRIITCALDERLDRNGYIAGPGLGDFGDLAMAGVDEAYAQARWVQPGLLTREQADLVLARTQALAAQ